PPPGALYYRIKQIDDDGAVVTSITMYLLNKVASEIAVFPNPGRQALNIIVPNLSASTPVHIRIIDAQGRTLWQQTGLFRQWHIPTLQWAKGVYRIVVQQGSSVNSLTWVLQ
ncbi:MAG TPA: T9SS type A sorting domain-containing protein, partial [Phnomibacter sp.]|nr:T9SS type A sorting domain-containing protein [Phnomibacter sp.]